MLCFDENIDGYCVFLSKYWLSIVLSCKISYFFKTFRDQSNRTYWNITNCSIAHEKGCAFWNGPKKHFGVPLVNVPLNCRFKNFQRNSWNLIAKIFKFPFAVQIVTSDFSRGEIFLDKFKHIVRNLQKKLEYIVFNLGQSFLDWMIDERNGKNILKFKAKYEIIIIK